MNGMRGKTMNHALVKPLPRLDPFSFDFRSAPYTSYARYRARGPLHWGKPSNPGLRGTWYVLGSALTRRVLTDKRFGREVHRRGWDPYHMTFQSCELRSLFSAVDHWLMFRDPPYHTKIRAAIAPAFAHIVVEGLRDRREHLAKQFAESLRGKSVVELMKDFTTPYVLASLCEFTGIPAEDAHRIQSLVGPLAATLDIKRDTAIYQESGKAVQQFRAYLTELLRGNTDPEGAVLLPCLRKAIASGELNHHEAIDSAILVLVTGQETTRNLICNGILSLLLFRQSLDAFAEEPELAADIVDETLRFESPVHLAGRIALEDMQIDGHFFNKEDAVVCCLASANRDPNAFSDPDHFDIKRSHIRHFSFGGGIHACIGVHLARLHASAAFAALRPLLLDVRLIDRVPVWRHSILFRSLAQLHIRR